MNTIVLTGPLDDAHVMLERPLASHELTRSWSNPSMDVPWPRRMSSASSVRRIVTWLKCCNTAVCHELYGFTCEYIEMKTADQSKFRATCVDPGESTLANPRMNAFRSSSTASKPHHSKVYALSRQGHTWQASEQETRSHLLV